MGSSNLKMGKILTVVVLPAVVMFSTGFTYKAFETEKGYNQAVKKNVEHSQVFKEQKEVNNVFQKSSTHFLNYRNQGLGAEEELEAARQAAINNTFNNNVINNYVNNNSESNSADSSAPSYNTYYVSSVYCGDYINAQGCVDSYSFTTVDYSSVGGPFWIGGHNHGPAGIINNFNVGDHVVVSGSGAGTYRITGFTYIPKGSGTDVRNFGGSIVFQTCTSTNMRVAYAERI